MLGEEAPGPRGPWRGLFMVSPESEQVFLGKEMGAHVSDDIDQQVFVKTGNKPNVQFQDNGSSCKRILHSKENTQTPEMYNHVDETHTQCWHIV